MATTLVNRLKQQELAAYRARAVLDQAGVCPLCGQHLALKDAVLDHRHKDGWIRKAIHRGCNLFLGKIENNIVRNRISDQQLTAILQNYQTYVNDTTDILHPRYRTPEEKRIRAQKRAKKRALKARKN